MSKASRLIEKLDGAVRPNRAAEKTSWQYAVNKEVDKEPTSWRSIIDPPTIQSVRPNTGRGHKS
jgi:hypothetical protein